MKRIALITILLAGILNVNAQTLQTSALATEQTVSTGPTAANQEPPKANETPADILGATTMDVSNRTIHFSNIPENHVVKAYITNADGEMIKNVKLSAANNTIQLGSMPPGLYYVTLFNKSKRKCFKMNL